MSLKVNISAETDETGGLPDIKAQHVVSVDASSCGDEAQAIAEAAQFMDRMDIPSLRLRYGLGAIDLRKGDDLKAKTHELFFSSCCFNLYEVPNLNQREFNFGDPIRPCKIEEAAHSALRISKQFDCKVSFKFNQVAVPPVEQHEPITPEHIRAVADSYYRAKDKSFRR